MLKRFFAVLFVMFFAVMGVYANNIKTYKFGAFTFSALEDAYNEFNTNLLITDANTKKIVNKLVPSGKTPGNIAAFLLQMPGNNVLFDTGLGQNLVSNLAKVGVAPENINNIFITHLHGDHYGGLVSGNSPVFKNAKLYIVKAEYNYWVDEMKNAQIKQVVDAYGQNVVFINMNDKFFNGAITVLSAVGHTPAHVVYELQSEGKKLLIVGDIIHVNAVQFANPTVAIQFDTDPDMAIKTRLKYFAQVSSNKTPIAGMHILFPSVGTLTKDGKGYKFQPIISDEIK
jgi:glyoxylase-like metal-dependent hydrolase (beta-lactamase superfamily II)